MGNKTLEPLAILPSHHSDPVPFKKHGPNQDLPNIRFHVNWWEGLLLGLHDMCVEAFPWLGGGPVLIMCFGPWELPGQFGQRTSPLKGHLETSVFLKKGMFFS